MIFESMALRCAIVSAVGIVGISAVARADEDGDASARAVVRGREGMASYERREWEASFRLFREADAIYHSPVFVLYEARAQVEFDHLLEARVLYRALGAESIDATSPTPWLDAQRSARAEEVALDVPSLVVVVSGAPKAPRALLDGASVEIGAIVEANPGDHDVVVTDGDKRLSKSVRLERGQRRVKVEVVFEASKVAPASRAYGWTVTGALLTGVGGAAVIAGAVLGGLAVANRPALPNTCSSQSVCPEFAREGIDASFSRTYRFASAADGLLIGGGVLAAVGVVILAIDPGHRNNTLKIARGRLEIRF